MKKLFVTFACTVALLTLPAPAFAVTPAASAAESAAACIALASGRACPAALLSPSLQPVMRSTACCITRAHDCYGQGGGFIDEDGNGVCDHYESGSCPSPNGGGYGAGAGNGTGVGGGYIDEDGNGVCDRYENSGAQGGSNGSGQGNGTASGNGAGSGYGHGSGHGHGAHHGRNR